MTASASRVRQLAARPEDSAFGFQDDYLEISPGSTNFAPDAATPGSWQIATCPVAVQSVLRLPLFQAVSREPFGNQQNRFAAPTRARARNAFPSALVRGKTSGL